MGDRAVFAWLYILEEYRGDILDSSLQSLKYLQYEFFAASAHAFAGALPPGMAFRPMPDMDPELPKAKVELELREFGFDIHAMAGTGGFSSWLIERQAKADG